MYTPLENISFSQTMISLISGTSPSTVFRVVKEKKIEHVNVGTSKTKKYDLQSTRKIISSINPPLTPIKKTQVFFNLKGGTGKTSVSYQTACHLVISGYRVLVIDCDSQGHLSTLLRFPEDEDVNTLYDVLINDIPIEESIKTIVDGLDAIPSNLSLSRVEVPLSQKARREDKLLNKIEKIKDNYDYILLDTNPSISTLNQNALVCADHINLVCETSPFSLYGLRLLLGETQNLFDEVKKKLRYKIICNRFESKTTMAQEVLGYIRSHYKENVYDSVIRKCEDINISTKERLPVSAFCKPRSIALEDIVDFLHEFLKESTSLDDDLKKETGRRGDQLQGE